MRTKYNSIFYTLIFFAFITCVFGIFFGYKEGSEIIQSLGLGLGAVLGALGGVTAFWEWIEKEKDKAENRDAKVNEFKKLFPRTDLGRTFDIIQPNRLIGWIHLVDKRQKPEVKHWIKDVRTLRDLGFSGSDAVTIDDILFDGYTQGIEIG